MLRPAGPDDLSQIDALIRAFPMQLLDRGPGFLAELLNDTESRLLVWDRGGFAGFAMIEAMYPQVANLSNLAAALPGQGAALIRATLDHCFGPLGLHRVFLDVAHDNPRGIAAFERAGFTREGTMRQCWLRPDGIWADCHAYGLLAHEWKAPE